MVRYDPQKIEKKWQQKWEDNNIFTVKEDLKKNLNMRSNFKYEI